jgi:molybdopterin converting factor small subunit
MTPRPVRVHLHAAAREAAGRSSVEVAAVDACDTAALRGLLAREHGPAMVRVLSVATLLVDGRPVTPGGQVAVPPGCTVEVLPPFAGG